MLLGTVHKSIISTGISKCADGSRATPLRANTQVDKRPPLNLEVAASASPTHSSAQPTGAEPARGPANAYCVLHRLGTGARALLRLGSTRELLDPG